MFFNAIVMLIMQLLNDDYSRVAQLNEVSFLRKDLQNKITQQNNSTFSN